MRPDAAMRDGKMDKLVKLDQYLIWLVDQAQTMTTWSNLSVILGYETSLHCRLEHYMLVEWGQGVWVFV